MYGQDIEEAKQIDNVTIEAKRDAQSISRLETQKTEVISSAGLEKLACCNLSESFENSASVGVEFSDAITGSKKIEMLGLSGIYTQFLADNIPTLRGLQQSLGLLYVPGTWLETIQVSKGTASVRTGYESITGQINLDFKKPEYSDRLFLNLYGSIDQRFELNLTSAHQLTDNTSLQVLAHASTQQGKIDENRDSFLDQPITQQYNIYTQLYTEKEDLLENRTGIKFVYDDRLGGQKGIRRNADFFTDNLYGIAIQNISTQAYNKTGFLLPNLEYGNLGIILSYQYNQQKGWFGRQYYDAQEHNIYFNSTFQNEIGESRQHKYSVGLSFNYDRITEQLDTLQIEKFYIPKRETVAGVFGEYTYSPLENITVIGGIRFDYNSKYGLLLTPRLHVKYEIVKGLTFRASAGMGYRSPNVLADNLSLLASARQFYIGQNINIEQAVNYGVNVVYRKDFNHDKYITVSGEYFRTDFQNQLIVDITQSNRAVYFYNLEGKSYSNTYQLDITTEFLKGLTIYAAARWNDIKTTYRQQLQQKPLVNTFRLLVNPSYEIFNGSWQFDITYLLNGRTKLPHTSELPQDYPYKTYSPYYSLLHAQITKRFKAINLDIYAGSENLLNFIQPHAILHSDSPFGQDFDATVLWGPVMGRKIYIGLRWTIF